MTENLKKLPIGKQDFASMIKENYLYVDKTEYIYKLISRGSVYFLSRPRRFGKSLTVSTLAEIFRGNKELFKNLWIYDKISWEKFPIIHIDFSEIIKKSLSAIESINIRLEEIASENNIALSHTDYGIRFRELIKVMAKEKNVVILIDEYDKPIIDFLEKGQISKALENREILKNFYSVLKGNDAHIRFLFITGVSKFSKVSIFSDLNHLTDITLNRDYACMLGCTEQEITDNFPDYLNETSKTLGVSVADIRTMIKDWYNGYNWHASTERVYNPFSLLNFFLEKEFKNYWFATGTPTFLINALKNQKKLPEHTGNILVGDSFFDKFDIENIDIVSLMFQSGYLTIIKSNNKGAKWLDYPNREVKDSFMGQLLEVYAQSHLSTTTGSVESIRFALDENDWETITGHFNILFSQIPYQIFESEKEFYYHSIIHTVLSLVGVDIHSEMQTSTGRIDTVIKNDKFIYVVEFKIGEAAQAMQQIKEKEYYKPFLNDGRQVVLVGVGFDTEKKEIGGWMRE
ncbi:MAG: AAA family ATPase [Bacteroidia bacterium]|nr:AAA family ATPase [Bacteroidia bacterium]